MAYMSREEDDPKAEPQEGQEEEETKAENNESPDPFMKEMQNPVYKGSKHDVN
jgi:hypothetical protein